MFLVERMVGIGQLSLRIYILKKLDVVDFNFAFNRLKKLNIDGIDINVIGLDDHILLKKAAVKSRFKSRDSEDLSYLEKLKARIQKK